MSTTKRNIGSNLTPEVELFGDWNKTKLLLSRLPRLVNEGADKGKLAAGKKLKSIVRKNIRNNGASIGWVPLSIDYALRKAKSGYPSDRIYYASGSYYNGIEVWNDGKNTYVGLPKGKKSRSSKKKLELHRIAKILEYGSTAKNIPARPLWVPSFKMLGGNRRIRGYITWHIRHNIKINTGLKVKITI